MSTDDILSLGTASPASSMSEFIDAGTDAAGDTKAVVSTNAAGDIEAVGDAEVKLDSVETVCSRRRHKAYFLEDEHIQLEAGDAVFRIHSHFFLRESHEARALVEQAKGTTLALDDVTADDLERFCDVLYCGCVPFLIGGSAADHEHRCVDSPPLRTQAEWTSVLHLAHRWNFVKIRALAISKLAALAGPVDRVVLAHTYDIDHWLPLAYNALCARTEWLSDEEGLKLGIHDVLKIGRARAAMRTENVTLNDSARFTLVHDIFHPSPDHGGATRSASAAAPPRAVEIVHTPLIVPASALPSTTEDLVLSPLPRPVVQELEASIDAVSRAQQEAWILASVFKPLAVGVADEISEARRVSCGTSTVHQMKHKISLENILAGERQLELYAAQVRAADAKVDRAQAAVAAIVARISE
jgi:hypothetical protein